ncbi:MAG TPA: hypothetical protein VFH83_12695, partial [Spirochaetia bacterium]|nr:hypothetical protein [Spirochaetia bacterium]
MRISRIEPTVFLKREPGGLAQLLRITVDADAATPSARLRVLDRGCASILPLGALPRGPSTHDVFLRERPAAREVVCTLLEEGRSSSAFAVTLQPVRHWTVHVVQRSHHDVGYTDLPSRVLKQQARYLDDAIDLARETAAFPDASRFRIVIEAAWSLQGFLEAAGLGRRRLMERLLRSGRFELAGLFGNLTTELCGHEEMIRALYPAFQLSRRYGFPVT